jgi:hypothetical protein
MAVLQSDGVNHTSDLILRRNGTEGLRLTSSTVQLTSINDGPLAGNRNRIINGDMRIDQRNNGSSVTTNEALPVDRWKQQMSGGGVFTSNRSTVAPTGFINSLLATVSTADASIAAADFYNFNQRIEGFNVDNLGFGTANAQTVTLSFWVRSSATGTFAGCLSNSAANRSYTFTYSISTANTWEYKTVTIPGDTSGTWLINSGIGIRVVFDLGGGSDSQGTANAWQSGFKSATAAAVKLISTLNATWQITGVQLEPGTVATPFERRPIGTELALCQRYFYRQDNYMGQAAPFDNEASGAVGQSSDTANVYRAVCRHPVEMRGTPTVTFTNVELWDGGVQRAVTTINNNNSSKYTRSVDWNMNGNMTALGRPAFEFIRPSGFIACSSEL